MSRRKEDWEQKAERRIRKWIIKKTFALIRLVILLLFVIFGIMFLISVIGIDEFAMFLVDSTRQIGSAVFETFQNVTGV